MSWNVTNARAEFARLLEEAGEAPQPIHKRGELVGWVVSAAYLANLRSRAERPSFAEAAEALPVVCEEEAYALEVPLRVDRPDPFDP